MSIKAQINFVAVLITMVVASSLFYTQKASHNVTLAMQEQKLLIAKQVLWQKVIDTQLGRMQNNARSLTRDRDTIKAIHKQQFDSLAELVKPPFNRLSVDGVITNISIYSPDGRILHSTDADSTTHTRSMLLEKAIGTEKNQQGLEFSEYGQLVARLVFPLYRRAKALAYVSYDYALDGAAENYKSASGFDLLILSEQGDSLYTTDDELTDRLALGPPLESHFDLGVVESESRFYSYETVRAQDQDGNTLAYVVSLIDDTKSIMQ